MKEGYTISDVTFSCRQWGSKAQTITLHYSTDGGKNYTSTGVTSTNFTIAKNDLPTGTNAVKITFSNTNNQVGVSSVTLTYTSSTSASLKKNDLTLNATEKVFDLKDGANQTFQLTNSGNADGALSYESDNTAVATVNSTGEITAIGEGTATITVTQAESSTYNGGTATCNVTVTDSRYKISNLTFTEKCNGSGTADDGAEWVVASDGSESNFDAERGIHYGTNSANVQYIELSTSDINGTIKKIVVNASTASGVTATVGVNVGGSAFGGEAQTLTTSAKDYTFTGSAEGEIIVTVTKPSSAAKAIYVKSVKVYYEPSTDPIINASNPAELAYNATSGSIAYELTNEVTGGVVTATSSENWLTVGTIADNSVALSCEANSAATKRVAEVTLTYTYNTNETVTKTVTVTQAANPDATMTIAEVRAQVTGDVETKGIVTSCSGSNAFIQDNEAAICIYDSNGIAVSIGDEVKVSGTLSTYKGLLEITSPEITVLSQGNSITPEVMTIAQVLSSTKEGWLVKIENATVTAIDEKNTTVEQNGSNIDVYDVPSEITYAVNDKLTFTGNIGNYDGKRISNPSNVIVTVNVEPAINLSTTPIHVESQGASGIIQVTYDNITEVAAEVILCDVNGEATTYDWIKADINDDNDVSYEISSNTNTLPRTCYLKVYAIDDEFNDVYSEVVSITQEGYVPDYATLPFVWNGGTKEDLLALYGVTENGLGSNYAESNAPYRVKLDTTGDYIQVMTDSQPGKVTICVKMIGGGSSSEITVQESADGETFSNVESLSISGTQNAELILETTKEFASSSRYVRLLFTKGSNVGVGAITIVGCSPLTITLNDACHDAEGKVYGTYSSSHPFVVSGDVVVSEISIENDAFYVEAYKTGDVVPANTGVMVSAPKGGDYTVNVAATAGTSVLGTANCLRPTGDDGITAEAMGAADEGCLFYRLTMHNGTQIGYWWGAENGAAFAVAANKAYMAIPEAPAARMMGNGFSEIFTGIVSTEQQRESVATYNLLGQRVSPDTKGVLIRNGKKLINK
ncbi:MAG: Ig-like domain-containing protein [Alloprevotella sp.]|nr:Ig-like domain-containing protein [Alloprevotella sp.]